MKADGWGLPKDQPPPKPFLFAYRTANIADGRPGSAVVYTAASIPNILLFVCFPWERCRRNDPPSSLPAPCALSGRRCGAMRGNAERCGALRSDADQCGAMRSGPDTLDSSGAARPDGGGRGGTGNAAPRGCAVPLHLFWGPLRASPPLVTPPPSPLLRWEAWCLLDRCNGMPRAKERSKLQGDCFYS